MTKVLVFGSKGMAGHMIAMYLKNLKKYEVFNTVNGLISDENDIDCDVFDINRVYKIIDDIKPNIIINCIGILNNRSDIDITSTTFINSFFPHYLESIGNINNIKIIHLSTDCVFTGNKGSYTETDLKEELGIYGVSKSVGEIVNKKDLTFRTSIIGPELKSHGKGLFHWFMNQSGDIDGYTKAYWTGVTTLELAKAIDRAIDENLCGLYNLVPKSKISKHDLLNIIKDEYEKNDININPQKNKVVDKSLVNTRSDFDYTVNDYKTMICQMKAWMLENANIYNQYFDK